MSGFVLDMLENLLGLTAEEKHVVEPVLPFFKIIVDAVNTRIDSALKLDQMFVDQQLVIKRLIEDYRVIGPNVSLLLGDQWVDVMSTLTAVKDAEAALKAFPTADLVALFNRLLPVINTAFVNWPKIAPAVTIILAAANRRGVTMGNVVGKLQGTLG